MLFLSKTHTLSPIMKKNKTKQKKEPNKSQLKAILQNARPVLFQTAKVIKNKASLRNCHSQEEPWES